MDEVLATARVRGVQTLILDADPGAEAFYARFGARTTGIIPSGSIPGRSLRGWSSICGRDRGHVPSRPEADGEVGDGCGEQPHLEESAEPSTLSGVPTMNSPA